MVRDVPDDEPETEHQHDHPVGGSESDPSAALAQQALGDERADDVGAARLVEGGDDVIFNIEIVSPWRSAGVPRFIAAAEVASEEYFNPVVPEDLAARLRELG